MVDAAQSGVSDKAVKKATGKGWQEWIDVIDDFGGKGMTHKEIAQTLADKKLITNGWWAQTITVGYEYAKGRRIKGETADAGFQIGVQKTFSVPAPRLWDWLISNDGQQAWLGEGVNLKLKPGQRYKTQEGAIGELRTIDPGKKLRLTWQPTGRDEPTTLQIYLLANDEKTSLRFHHEKLASAQERTRMKKHWQTVLARIDSALKS